MAWKLSRPPRPALLRPGLLRPARALGSRVHHGTASPPPFDLGDGGRRRVAPTVAAGLLAISVLGALALFNGIMNMRTDERKQLADRVRLVEDLAAWASASDDPALLVAAIQRSELDPNASRHDLLLALRPFQITPAGDAARLVALLDVEGHVLATSPETGTETSPQAPTGSPGTTPTRPPIADYQLGEAWERAKAGEAAVSPVFTLAGQPGQPNQTDRPSRALVAPVGTGQPWAVLVVVSDEAAMSRLADGVANLVDMTDGSISTVDPTGTAILSSDPTLIGRTVVDPSQTGAGTTAGSRTTGEGPTATTEVAARQPSTGYTTVLQQRTEAMYADVRAQHRQRGLTVVAVTVGAVLSIGGFGLAREHSAGRARARLHTLLSSAHDVIAVVGSDGVTTFMSPAIRHLLGHDPASCRGRPLTELVHPGDVSRVERMLTTATTRTALNVRLRSATGDYRWFDLATSETSDHPGLDGVVVTSHEVGRRKSLQDQLGHQAGHDPLTGLPNRETFQLKVEEALRENLGSKPVAVLYVDLDRFKPVNDTFGHETGDRLLRVVASRLDAAVGDRGVASRFGGDEFGLVATVANLREARRLADRVIASVRRPLVVRGRPVSVDASVGVALSGQYQGCHDLLRAADQAMYAAKRGGRGRCAVAGGAGTDVRAGTRGDSRGDTRAAAGSPARTKSDRPDSTCPAGEWTADTSQSHSHSHSRGQVRRRLGRAAPLVTTGAVLLATTIGCLVMEAAANHDARAQRMVERKRLTAWLADYTGAVTNPERMMAPASQLPWTFDGSETDQLIVRRFADSPMAGGDTVVALLDLDGRTISAYPHDAVVPFRPSDEVWRFAMAGRGANAPLVADDQVLRSYSLAPVLRESRPVAMMVVGQSVEQAPGVALLTTLSSLGFGDGEISIVDTTGRAAYCWDPSRVGQHLVPPEELASLPTAAAATVTLSASYAAARPGSVALASRMQALPGGGYLLFDQPAPAFYSGIQDSQRVRESMLFAITGITLVGLAGSHRRRARTLREGEAYLRVLLHHAHDIVAVLDRDDRTTFVSSAVGHLLDLDAEDLVGRCFVDLLHPEDVDRLLRRAPSAVHVEDVRLRRGDGSYRWFDVDLADLTDEPSVGGILLTCHEISERKALQDELRRQATHDPLTGLGNRAALSAHLAAGPSRRDGEGPMCVLLVDLDDFKPVNDTLGHAAGDEVLRVVAERLRGACRPGDAVFRLGGDEFVVVTTAGESLARFLAERLRAVVHIPIMAAGTAVTVDATIGIAVGADPDRPDAVVRDADLAMYEAKRAGRGRHQVFERDRSRSGLSPRS